MKKIIFAITTFLMLGAVYAQKADEQEIELPDVTTVISGGALTAGKDAIPDYKDILPDSSTSAVELPDLGTVDDSEVKANARMQTQSDKDVFAEGRIGGGFPLTFTGNFSIYRTTGNSPFEINFNHESYEGLGGNKAQDGYFLRTTGVSALKEFNSATARNKLSATYVTGNNGLQLNSPSFTDEVQHSIVLDYDGNKSFKNGMFIAGGAGGSVYNRYGTTYKGAADTAYAFETSAKTLWLNPNFGFGWMNNKFLIGFDAAYSTELNLKASDSLEKAPHASSAESVHRGQFTINTSYTADHADIWAKAAAVIGNSIGDNRVIVPFALGTHLAFFEGKDSLPVTLALEGGCDSIQNRIDLLESKYRWSVAACLPVETTDWYGKAKLTLPVQTSFNIAAAAEYRKTAFDNGIWYAGYDEAGAELNSGYYALVCGKRTDFNTSVEFTAVVKDFKLTGRWNAFWMDVPVLEVPHSLEAGIFYQESSARWSAGASIKQAMGEDADAMPDLSADVAVKASKSIRLALELNDVIKLVTNKTRDYAASSYKARGGNAMLLVKFQF